jgi:hypothetical protein
MESALGPAELSQVDTLFESLGVQPGNIAFTSGAVVHPAVSISKQLVPTEGLENLLLRSIRNTLDGKRVQFPNDGHYLLAMKLGDHRLLPTGFIQMTLDRIWNNPDYAWITGLCFFSPREDFRIEAPPSSLFVTFNPNARSKATQALIDLFEGRRTFHLP